MTLPYSTNFPKPGDTLTAAQANSLPMGSETSLGGLTFERLADGWACKETEAREMILYTDGHTLLRVGPPTPQFVVGQVVSNAQAFNLPVGSIIDDAPCCEQPREKGPDGKWRYADGRLVAGDGMLYSLEYTILRIVPDPSAPAEGTWGWAKAQMQAGKCVKAEGWQPKRIIDGVQHYWAYPKGPWVPEDGAEHDDRDWSRSTDWRVFPGTSAPAETPVVHMDLAEVCAALDEAIPEWRGGMTVAQAVGKLNLRIGLYQVSEAELRAEVESLTAERDAAISEIGKSCATMAAAHADEIKSIAAERDAALARADAAEAMRDFNEGRLQAARNRAEAAEARLVVPEDVRKWAIYMVQIRAGRILDKRAAAFILSLADHLPEAKKMVQSQHPEGSREWAEDAIQQGFSVAYEDQNDGSFWKDFKCVSRDADNGRKWESVCESGWRIHTPAVAPEPLPSIAQIWARIAAIEERLGDVEAGV